MTVMDISSIPFSRFGAYVSITSEKDEKRLIIHNVRRRTRENVAFELRFEKDNAEVNYAVAAYPHVINIYSPVGNAQIYIRNDKSIVIDSDGLDVFLKQLSKMGYGIQEGERQYKLISQDKRIYTLIYVQNGKALLSGPIYRKRRGDHDITVDRRQELKVRCEGGKATLCLEISQVESKSIPLPIDVKKEITEIKKEWESFLAKMPPVPDHRRKYAEITWYNIWSSFVRAEDVYKNDVMLMSKKFMSSVWSWDHCFNALAIAEADLKRGIDQFLAPFELQSETGVLPDYWNPNSEIVWGVTKPPIHGWCFGKLMDKYDIADETLKKVYGHLEKWTNWWMEYCDSDGDGIPEYPQGCDSGWDNSTLFDIGFFLESPDLSAYLVLQMKTLARIAQKIDYKEKAHRWEEQAQKLLERLYEHSWVNDRFVAKLSRTHKYEEKPTSLQAIMPIVLGDLLDKDKFDRLVEILRRDFLTENGPATEAPNSPLYRSDGYWGGPIWAPSTYLIVDGLKRGGRIDLAKRIAKSFCDMVQYKAKGNYENFDAITGKGLRDPGYTWTASVYMLLIWEYWV